MSEKDDGTFAHQSAIKLAKLLEETEPKTLEQKLLEFNWLGKPLHPDLVQVIIEKTREWLQQKQVPPNIDALFQDEEIRQRFLKELLEELEKKGK